MCHTTLTARKWSSKVTCPSLPSAIRRAYCAFLMECIDTASVIVSTRPEVPPVMRIRKLGQTKNSELMRTEDRLFIYTHNLTQHGQFSSFQMCSNSRISCTASCSCLKSLPALTITGTQSQLATSMSARRR